MFIDNLFMEFVHFLCVKGGFFFTPFFRIISLLGEKCWFFLLIAFLFCLRKKTRWIGITIIFSIFLGYVIGDICLKPLIMRLRPYTANNKFQTYWALAGSYPEIEYSMPSGHCIGVAAFFISFYITGKKSWRKNIMRVGVISITLMILSRTYFMHHYLTDCLVGILIAFITSYIAKSISKLLYDLCKRYENIKIFNFVLNFDILKSK